MGGQEPVKTEKYFSTGLLAHVDAGKTTLSEALLYLTGAIRKMGRVDDRDAFLDTYELERERGITIFSKQAIFDLGDTHVTLLDTPGHVDFSAEMERTIQVLDAAILVVSGADGVQGHTRTVWRLLKRHHIPVFLFVNKMDQSGCDAAALMKDLKAGLDENCVDFGGWSGEKGEWDPEKEDTDTFYQELAVCDEAVMEAYFENGSIGSDEIGRLVRERKVFPCYFGSALKLKGVEELLAGFQRYGMAKGERKTEKDSPFGAKVFKISRDSQGNRLTHLKVTSGVLKVKDAWGEEEKVNQIRIYSGAKFESVKEAPAGCICAVTGPIHTHPGQGIGSEPASELPMLEPVLTYRILLPFDSDVHKCLQQFKQLEEEEPELHVLWNEELGEIQVQLMGDVQIEILKHMLEERYGLLVGFDTGNIVYKETILNTVEGVGHFEPLRHYAEVHLLLEPLPRGSGLLFESDCKDEVLDRHWQRLILSHLQETEHVGVLSGSPITDMKITLLCGRAHQKHTEGGDFRQATYRALRHGLRSAESILLEPYYEFTLRIPPSCVSRAVFDIERFHGTFTLQEDSGEMSVISGSAPVRKLQSYPQEVYAYTKGKGRLFCTLKGYEACADEEDVLKEVAYDCDADMDHPCGSIFCSHGAGYYVPWNEVKQHMHMQSDWGRMQLKRESYQSYTAKPVDEKELEEIFIRTYGPIKRRPPQKAKPASNIIDLEKQNICYQPLPECLLVDGYNVIHDWEELKAMAKEHLDAARHRLIDIMCSYQGYRGCELILVFDAYKVKAGIGSSHKEGTIHVVYTKQAQTADMYIEQATHQLASEFRVTVATSDGMEQLIASGQGASRMSSRQLYAEVLRMKNTSVKEFERKQLRGGAEPLKKLREYRIEDADEEMKS